MMNRKALYYCRICLMFAICRVGTAIGETVTEALPGNLSEYTLSAISEEYCNLTDTACKDLTEKLKDKTANAAYAIKTVWYLRAKEAAPLLMMNLGHPVVHMAYTYCVTNNADNKEFKGVVTNTGEKRFLQSAFPAVGAAERVGVSLAAVTNAMPYYPSSFVRDCVFAHLGRSSSGPFFYTLFDTLFEDGDDPDFALVREIAKAKPPSFPSMFFGKERGYTNYNVQACNRYDAMQDELISRFKSQLENGDAELADTIHTMGFIRSDKAMPLLIENLTVCPQTATNSPSGLVFPAAEALISIWPPLGICFEKLEAAQPMSVQESLWLRITHEVYPEAVEYDLMKKAEQGDRHATRLLASLPWRRLGVPKADSENPAPTELQ